MDQKTVAHLHDEMLSSRKKEGAPTLCNSMVGTGDYYAKSGVSNSLSLGGHISLAVAFKGPNVISTP